MWAACGPCEVTFFVQYAVILLQRVKELNLQGPNGLKGQLNTAIDLLTGSFVHQALAGAGPFTLFLMVDDAFANLTQEQVKLNE